ncbi:hypothetical protein Tcan_12420 [Toxocara canis]|uniref:Uncharacterized protein n=1 Tax=Toxocara canis TaxID=6265 RepID=A0A0B2UUC3_TOXCA|nr:hypothetical protein Tcan_12420 [Toxocara canis]
MEGRYSNLSCGVVYGPIGNEKLERLRAIISGACDIQQLVTVCCYLEKGTTSIQNAEQKLSQV